MAFNPLVEVELPAEDPAVRPAAIPFVDLRQVWLEGHENILRQARAMAPWLGVSHSVDLEVNPWAMPLSPESIEAMAAVLEAEAEALERKSLLFASLAVQLGAWADEVHDQEGQP